MHYSVRPGGFVTFIRFADTADFMHNNPDGTLRAKIYPPLYTPRTKDKEKDFYDVTKELITVLEHEIIENPPMWFWVHDRWKDGRQRFAAKK
mgnify:CR=1 FL=1